MPKGQKTCPKCDKACGPRTKVCPCGNVFEFRAKQIIKSDQVIPKELPPVYNRPLVFHPAKCPFKLINKKDIAKWLDQCACLNTVACGIKTWYSRYAVISWVLDTKLSLSDKRECIEYIKQNMDEYPEEQLWKNELINYKPPKRRPYFNVV